MKYVRVYIPVLAAFGADGKILPRQLMWTDGRKYSIDRVLDVKSAAAMKAGGQGDRYTIRVNGQERYIFFERNNSYSGNNLGRWFVECPVY